MDAGLPRLITVGVIADDLREPMHRVLHVLATREHIRPAAYAAGTRLFDRRAVALIRAELDAIDARRNRKNRQGMGESEGFNAD
jgi:hypothetical protein